MIYVEGIAPASKTSPKPVALAILGDGSPLSPDFMAVVRKNNIVLSRSSDRTMRAMGKVIGYGNRNSALAARKAAPVAPVAIPELGAGAQPEWLGKKVLAALGIAIPAGGRGRGGGGGGAGARPAGDAVAG